MKQEHPDKLQVILRTTWEEYAKNKVNSFFEERMKDVLDIVKLKKEDLENYYMIKNEVFRGFWSYTLPAIDSILEHDYSYYIDMEDTDDFYDKYDIEGIKEIEGKFQEYFFLPDILFDLFSLTKTTVTEERRKVFLKIIKQRIQDEYTKANHSEFKILWSAKKILDHLQEDDYERLNPFYRGNFTYLILFRKAQELFLKSYSHKKRGGYTFALRDANDELKIYSPDGFRTNIVQISDGYKTYRANQKNK